MPEIMEHLGTFRKKINSKFGNEREKKVDAVLLQLSESSKQELHGVSALTYNDKECDMIMQKIIAQVVPNKNSWKEILKALQVLENLVLTGSERVVQEAMDHKRSLGILVRYNSALSGYHGKGAGRDEGAPVRSAASKVMDLLDDTEKLRGLREGGSFGLEQLAKFSPKKQEDADPFATTTGATVFGAGGKAPVGAKYSIEDMKGMYDGRAERFFDKGEEDPRGAERAGSYATGSEDLIDFMSMPTPDSTADAPAAAAFGEAGMNNVVQPNYAPGTPMHQILEMQEAMKKQQEQLAALNAQKEQALLAQQQLQQQMQQQQLQQQMQQQQQLQQQQMQQQMHGMGNMGNMGGMGMATMAMPTQQQQMNGMGNMGNMGGMGMAMPTQQQQQQMQMQMPGMGGMGGMSQGTGGLGMTQPAAQQNIFDLGQPGPTSTMAGMGMPGTMQGTMPGMGMPTQHQHQHQPTGEIDLLGGF